jgi:hypothetical protein
VQPRHLALLAGLLVAGAAAAAEPPIAPGGIPDLVGSRSLALSSGVGIAGGNDGIFVNMAALAARKRYSVDASFLVDRRGADTEGQAYGTSVVDSSSAAVTGAMSFVRVQKGADTGNMWLAGLAGAVAEKLYLGVLGKFFSLTGDERTRAATVDAGLFWQVTNLVSIGAAGYNLVSIANERIAPMGMGAGLTIGSDASAQITADWRADFDRAGKTANRYGVGAEVLLGRLVPVRAGFQQDEILDTKWWSVGTGLVSRNGVALDVGYRQSTENPSARTIAASLRVFLFN